MNIVRQWKSVRFGGKSEEASLAWPDRLGGKMSRFREAIAMESADVRDSARVTRRKSTRRLSITIFSVGRPPNASVPLSSPFILHFLPKKRHRNRFRTPYAAFHAVESKEKAFRAPLLHLSTPTLVHNPFFFVYNLYSRDRNCDVNSIKLIIY